MSELSLFTQSSVIVSAGYFILVEYCSLYNKQNNAWMFENTRSNSRVEMIFPTLPTLTREISCSTLKKTPGFPRTHVLFSIYQLFRNI